MFIDFISYCARQQMRNIPGVLEAQMGLHPTKGLLATARSRICIDGFPRSGNGFSIICAHAFSALAGESLACHTHSAANVLRAVRLGLPTFVLLRDPLDSCLSLTAMMGSRPNQLADCLQAWRVFYTRTERALPKVTLAPFPTLVEHPYLFAAEVARAVGVEPPAPTPDFGYKMRLRRAKQDLRSQGQDPLRASLPNAEKQGVKADILRQQMTGAAPALLDSCRALHRRLLDQAPNILRPARDVSPLGLPA